MSKRTIFKSCDLKTVHTWNSQHFKPLTGLERPPYGTLCKKRTEFKNMALIFVS